MPLVGVQRSEDPLFGVGDGGCAGPEQAVAVLRDAQLRSWTWIGIAWLLHTCIDVAHAVRGADILPFAPHCSVGCAICDPVIALWCLAGGPTVGRLAQRIPGLRRTATGTA